MKAKFLLYIVCIIGWLPVFGQDAWKAGVAKTVITPETPLWMAGYASRTQPGDGKIHDLWVKALALEDVTGRRAVVVTSDMLGFTRSLTDRIRQRLEKELDLTPAQILLNSSHSHSGPVLPHALVDIYTIDAPMQAAIERYDKQLEEWVVRTIVEAFEKCEPARLYAANGTARFQVNRRNNSEREILTLNELKGPNDHAVPVLKVVSASDEIRAILFGYACHPTVLSGYEFSGDYPGFAQIALEESYPGAMALFFQGAGADQNPLPRRTVALARQYGKTLAAAVECVLEGEMELLPAALQVSYSEVDLPLEAPPTTEELEQIIETQKGYQQNWAKRMLNEKQYISSYPYPVQVWNVGGLPLVSLGGEVAVQYAIDLKKALGQKTFVFGYANDVMAYIPSAVILEEGGYEGNDSQKVYGLPAVWKKGIDEHIMQELLNLANLTNLIKYE